MRGAYLRTERRFVTSSGLTAGRRAASMQSTPCVSVLARQQAAMPSPRSEPAFQISKSDLMDDSSDPRSWRRTGLSTGRKLFRRANLANDAAAARLYQAVSLQAFAEGRAPAEHAKLAAAAYDAFQHIDPSGIHDGTAGRYAAISSQATMQNHTGCRIAKPKMARRSASGTRTPI